MADADVPITAGSGTKIDTRTVGAGTDEHRQVVVVGDPTTAANVGAVSAAGRLSVDASGVAVPVTDNSGSLTVDSTQWPSALVGGRLDVNIGASGLSSLAVANVETIADNAGFTDGTSKVFPQGYIFDESAGTALTENDVGAARMDSKRAIVNVLEDATTRGRRATVSATGGLLGDQGAPATPANAWYVRSRTPATYGAGYRIAVAASGIQLAFTFAANTDKQLATIYHTAGSTKTVRIRYASVSLLSGAAGAYMFEIRSLSATTAPATGNPAITPGKYDFADGAAEAACLALPTTAGSDVNVNQPVSPQLWWNSGVAAASTNPSGMDGQELVLHNSRDGADRKPLTMPAGTACGFAIVGRCNAAVALSFSCFVEFTEE
jgi:hypothetical protein